MKITLFVSMLAFFSLSNIANAQVPVFEKSFEVTNRAKRGFLESIEMNKEKGTIDLIYALPNASTTDRERFLNIVTTNASGKAKYEVYSYDKDLNPLGTSREEERMSRYRWKDYSYTTVEPTIKLSCLCLSFKQVQTTATYNWFSGYKKTNKVIDRVKAENDDGGNYTFTGITYDLYADKSILTIAGKKVKKDPMKAFMLYDILRVDNDVNIQIADTLNFKYSNSIIYSAPLKDQKDETNDELARDWIIVFASMKGTAAKATDLTYVRISPKGKVLENFSFNSPSNAWHIEGSYEQNGAVYLYGSAITKDPAKKYYADIVNKGWDKLIYTNFQIGKISNGKLDFISSISFDDLQAKQTKPANQKKVLELDGKECNTSGIHVLNTGEILITYQDYEIKSGINQQTEFYKKQNNVFLFQFDASGNFKKNYGVENDPDRNSMKAFSSSIWEIPAAHYFYPSADGKNLYWLIRSVKDADCIGNADANQNSVECKPMNGIAYGSINLESGAMSEFKTFGEDSKKPFYLFSNTTAYQMDNFIYFFSETEKGDKMLISRIDISK